MDKIIIVSRESPIENMLFASLAVVFPECEIHVIYEEPKAVIKSLVPGVESKDHFEVKRHDET